MHILMISLDYPPTVGGITAHVYELSQALIKVGCQVTVVTRQLGKLNKVYEEIDQVDVYRMPLKYFGFTYGWQINRYVKHLIPQVEPDIIHIHGMRPLEFYSIKQIPLVYTNHTSGYLKRIKKAGYRIPILKRLFNKPDLILAPSEELLEIPFSIKGIKQFISNGVVSEKFNRDVNIRKTLRKKLGFDDKDIVAIITRRMVWKNGVSDLAKAMQYIKNPDLKLLLIGDGPELTEITQRLEKYFSGRYKMLGALKHEAIIPYYSAADLSILPSLMEATSISGLEAMASSLALVGTRVGGIPVLIKEGENGYLCQQADPKDLAEKLDHLLASDFKLMGKESRRLVEKHFDWIEIAQQTKNAYEQVLT